MKLHILIPLATAIAVACATKSEPCGDGMARADDGNCYELGGAADDTASNNQLPDSDGDADGDADGGDADLDADGDIDEGPPADEGGDEGPPADEGGDEGPPPDEGGDEGPPPDEGGDADGAAPDESGGDDPPDPDVDGDADEGPPPDGPTSCSSDSECEGECFEEGYDCVCDPTPSMCAPACDSTGECPSPFECNADAESADGVAGICEPGGG